MADMVQVHQTNPLGVIQVSPLSLATMAQRAHKGLHLANGNTASLLPAEIKFKMTRMFMYVQESLNAVISPAAFPIKIPRASSP